MKETSALQGAVMIFFLTCQVDSKLVDLSHTQGPNTLTAMPNHPRYNLTHLVKGETDFGVYIEANYYGSSEHSGTHMDAPSHFQHGGVSLDKVPLEHTVLEGVVIDQSLEASRDSGHVVSVQALEKWEETHGKIPHEAAVLFYFGWYPKFDNEDAYRGSTTVNDSVVYVFPTISMQAASWLLDKRSVRTIGSDTISPERGPPKGLRLSYTIHQLLLSANRLIVENLRDLDKLPPRGFRFYAAPVKYEGASGAQIRAFAMTYDNLEGGAGLVSVSLTLSLLSVLPTLLL